MGDQLSIISLVVEASMPVQIVIGMLLLASLTPGRSSSASAWSSARARRGADQFENSFWSGGDLAQLYRAIEQRGGATGMASIFEFGFREFARLRQQGTIAAGPVVGRRAAGHARGAVEGDRPAGGEPRDPRHRRLHQPVCRPVRHRVGHHERVLLAGKCAAGDACDGGSRHFGGADHDGLRSVRRHSGGRRLQPLRRPGGRLEIRFDAFTEEFSTILQRHAARGHAPTSPALVGVNANEPSVGAPDHGKRLTRPASDG